MQDAEQWSNPSWLATAREWIHARLREQGIDVTGPVDQPHLRPWATVLRVPTDQGMFWFKANGAGQAHEAGVVELLARRRPDAVPELVAVDDRRSWLLLADGGKRLREVVESERELGRWLDVLKAYARLQLDMAPEREALLAAGAPERGLSALPILYDHVIAVAHNVPAEGARRLRGLSSWVADGCAQLTSLGVPETIQHDDLHDGQVFVRDDGYLFFDWGDSCVGHPFLTMAITLEGVLSCGLADIEGSVDTTPFADAYLEPFADFAPRQELTAGLDIGLRLGWICRALNNQAALEALGPAFAATAPDAVAVRLRMFLAGF